MTFIINWIELYLRPMIKKCITYFFLFVFLLASSGIPALLHFCERNNAVSFSSCEICEEENEEPSCCREDEEFDKLQFKQTKCCTEFSVQSNIEEFVSITIEKIKVQNQVEFVNSTISDFTYNHTKFVLVQDLFRDKPKPKIYLQFESLLI